MKNNIELLSPVGSPESLRAAVLGGADAVYLGGKAFNARMNAKNFDGQALKSAVEYCHDNGVRLFVTLNTLIYDREMKEALKYAESLYKMGIDALIIADIGLAGAIHKYLPDFELHASTQMSGHNTAASEYLHKHGYSRMVCAREMSKQNIKSLCENSQIEIEMFIHGAMCVCHSGQCLMSSFIGGRSGNRGACAQPCRLPYNGSPMLSLKDMCLADHITELLDTGVRSLKIEGRMKSPDYVYSVTSTYRKLLDEGRNASRKEIDRLSAVFSRSGFSDGYFTSKIDNGMLGIRRDSDIEQTRKTGAKIVDCAGNRSKIIVNERSCRLPDGLELTPVSGKPENSITARFYRPENITGGELFDIIYLPLEKFTRGKANGVILPAVIFDSEIPVIEAQLKAAKEKGARHALVGNIGHIELAKKYGFILHGDYRLNICNSLSAAELSFFDDVILSPELTLPQIRDIRTKKSVIVYGKVPVMTLEKPTGQKKLRDRRNTVFNCVREGRRDIVFNSVPFYMADKQDEMKKSGITSRHFIFSDETVPEINGIINAYRTGKSANKPIKRIK